MPQARAPGQEDGTETLGILGIILIIIVIWLFSEFYWVYATAWKWLRIVELGVLSYAIPDFVQQRMDSSFSDGLKFLLTSDPKDLSKNIVTQFDGLYVKYFNWFPAAIMGVIGIKLFMNAEDVTTTYNMENLMTKMVKAFPHNKPFIGVNPEKTPLDFYPDDEASYEYSMCMSERQFAQVIPPLGLTNAALKNEKLLKPIWDGKKGFDEALARRSFESQMGPLYKGYNHLSEDERTLMDLFRNKMLIKRKEVVPILQDYAMQAYKSRISSGVYDADKKKRPKKGPLPKVKFEYSRDFASHKALAEKMVAYVDAGLSKGGPLWRPKDAELRTMVSSADMKSVLRHVMADERLSHHAYTYTGLMTLLEAAREGATLAPSSLRWLKGRNRTLWYALNCVGKKVAFTESAGTFAHWLLEKEAKMAIPHAEVTEAVDALKIALGLLPKNGRSTGTDEWG